MFILAVSSWEETGCSLNQRADGWWISASRLQYAALIRSCGAQQTQGLICYIIQYVMCSLLHKRKQMSSVTPCVTFHYKIFNQTWRLLFCTSSWRQTQADKVPADKHSFDCGRHSDSNKIQVTAHWTLKCEVRGENLNGD